MTLLLVFVACLFTTYALWLTIAPFVGGADEGLRLEHLDEEVREIELLVAQREVLVKSLRELDFDRETDKLAPEDHARFRRRYESQAVTIMRRLDEIHGGRDWRARVDTELTERLGRPPRLSQSVAETSEDVSTPAAPEPPNDLQPEHDGVDADEIGEPGEPGPCSSCGEPLAFDDRFCRKCGASAGLIDADAEADGERNQANSEASA